MHEVKLHILSVILFFSLLLSLLLHSSFIQGGLANLEFSYYHLINSALNKSWVEDLLRSGLEGKIVGCKHRVGQTSFNELVSSSVQSQHAIPWAVT